MNWAQPLNFYGRLAKDMGLLNQRRHDTQAHSVGQIQNPRLSRLWRQITRLR